MANKVRVVYRKIAGEVLAIFPGEREPGENWVMTYARIGQHGGATMGYCRNGRLATELEYNSLHRELVAIYAPEFELVIGKKLV